MPAAPSAALATLFLALGLAQTTTAAGVDHVRWELLNADFASSRIRVLRAGLAPAELEAPCDLRDAMDEPAWQQEEDPPNRVEILSPPALPAPLLLVSCAVGAHSRQIDVYDLSRSEIGPPRIFTGSFIASWRIEQGHLLITVDHPCISDACAIPFQQHSVRWDADHD